MLTKPLIPNPNPQNLDSKPSLLLHGLYKLEYMMSMLGHFRSKHKLSPQTHDGEGRAAHRQSSNLKF